MVVSIHSKLSLIGLVTKRSLMGGIQTNVGCANSCAGHLGGVIPDWNDCEPPYAISGCELEMTALRGGKPVNSGSKPFRRFTFPGSCSS